MFYQTAKTAVTFLTSRTDHAADEMSEAAYFRDCAKAEARAQRRSLIQRLRAAYGAIRALNWVTPGRATGAGRADMATLLRCDPHLLQDMGIATTPFGGLVLDEGDTQSADLRLAPPAPLHTEAPTETPAPVVARQAAPRFAPLPALAPI